MQDWVPIREFPRYSINDQGRVRNDRTQRVMKVRLNNYGHLVVNLTHDGKQSTRSIARLVCEAFVPNPGSHRFNTPIHLDGDLSNCCVENLTWRPRWFADKYTRQFKLNHKDTRPIRNVRTGEVFSNVWELVTSHGVLYMDVVLSIARRDTVFPTSQQFAWVD